MNHNYIILYPHYLQKVINVLKIFCNKNPSPNGEGSYFQPNHLYSVYWSAVNFQPNHLYPAYWSAANFHTN